MSSAEIKRGEKYSEFLGRKEKLEKLHKKAIGKAISVVKPANILNKINEDYLKGRGEVTKESLPYLKVFNLEWTDWYVEAPGLRIYHQITIAFCSFLIEPNQVIKNVDQLLRNDTPKGTVYPCFVVLGGSETKAIRNNWENIAGAKNIYSLNPDTSTVFGIPTRLGEINKVNLIKKIEPSFEEALKKAYRNSALKK